MRGITRDDDADPIQEAREEAERRQRRRGNPAAPTSSSAAFFTALGLFVGGDRVQAAWHLRRAQGTLRRSFLGLLAALVLSVASPRSLQVEGRADPADAGGAR